MESCVVEDRVACKHETLAERGFASAATEMRDEVPTSECENNCTLADDMPKNCEECRIQIFLNKSKAGEVTAGRQVMKATK